MLGHAAESGTLPQENDRTRQLCGPYVGARPIRASRVPVTATLSKAFYEKFGEQVTNELVT